MTNHQDVAVPSLPLSETLALAIKLGVAYVDFEEQAEIDGFLHTFGNACYEAGRAAGRASAEPEGFVLVPREPTPAMMRVGLSSMWPRAAYQSAAVENVWIRMCRVGADPSTEEMTLKAITAAPTPTASIAPKADPLSASVESHLAERASKPFESEGNRRAAPKAEGEAPIDMVLHCPACGTQHIDAPESMAPKEQPQLNAEWGAWANPPHRSHLCHGCGHVWRPADVPTNGVAAIKTMGKADSPIAAPVAQAAAGASERERLRAAQDAAVMPLIGPLLDAWECSSHRLRDEFPELAKQLRAIDRAMEEADADHASGGGV